MNRYMWLENANIVREGLLAHMDEKIVKTILIEVIGDVSIIEYHQIEEFGLFNSI